MGSAPGGSRFPVKVSGMRSSGDAGTETGREEYEADKEKGGVRGVVRILWIEFIYKILFC